MEKPGQRGDLGQWSRAAYWNRTDDLFITSVTWRHFRVIAEADPVGAMRGAGARISVALLTPRRSAICSPTRIALAIAVSAGLTAPMLGKKQFFGEEVAALQEQYPLTGLCNRVRESPAARACADHYDVEVVGQGILPRQVAVVLDTLTVCTGVWRHPGRVILPAARPGAASRPSRRRGELEPGSRFGWFAFRAPWSSRSGDRCPREASLVPAVY